jgi:hypothetical protein
MAFATPGPARPLQPDDVADGIDMFDALHPQTILAYGMNGLDLSCGPDAYSCEMTASWHRRLSAFQRSSRL